MQNSWTFKIKFLLLFYVNFPYKKIFFKLHVARACCTYNMQQDRHHESAKPSLWSNDTEANNLTASYNLMSYQFLDTFICNLVSPPTWPLVTPGDGRVLWVVDSRMSVYERQLPETLLSVYMYVYALVRGHARGYLFVQTASYNYRISYYFTVLCRVDFMDPL